MKGLILKQKGFAKEHFEVQLDLPKPTPGPKDILIKVVYSALNPIDFVMAAYGAFLPDLPFVLGCEASGFVEEVGTEVTNFQKGDEVFAYTTLGNHGYGSFAEYCLAPVEFVAKKPSELSFQEAATIPVGALTAAIGLFKNMQILFPSKGDSAQGKHLLVWGGSSTVGSFAIQFAKACGFTVIATCSPKNFEFVKGLGASYAFDYSNEDAVNEIIKITDGKLQFGFDPTANVVSTTKILACLSKDLPCQMTAVLPTYKGEIPSNVSSTVIALGASSSDPFFQTALDEVVSLIKSKKMSPSPIQLLPNGFEGILPGLQLHSEKKVSAQKLLVQLSD